MRDQERMHLKQIEDASRDKYMQDVRDMTTAAAASNTQMLGEKQSRENAWRQYEQNRDNSDLN